MKKLEDYRKEEKERILKRERHKLAYNYGLLYVAFVGFYIASFFLMIGGVLFLFNHSPFFQMMSSIFIMTGFIINYFSPMMLVKLVEEYERKKKRIR